MSRWIFILLISTILCTTEARRSPFPGDKKIPPLPKSRSDPAKYRLPSGTTPNKYEVILKVDPNNQDSFSGSVKIDVTADEISNSIVLHSDVRIGNISVKVVNGSDIYDTYMLSNDDAEFLTIYLKEDLVVGQKYDIEIHYIGNYGRFLNGLYLSSYTDNDGNKRNLATTQFQPIEARRAFPCYDEPGLKAVFQINIYAPTGFHAISNTDLTNDTSLPGEVDGHKLYAFKPTEKMSSYLIAFVISDFAYKSNLEEGQQHWNGKKIRIFARPNAIQYGSYALDFGQKSIAALENYTGVEYALDKLDNVAVPDFSAGAMENWGLVTYREPYLLTGPGSITTSDLEFIGIVISHEFAHMWFGDEVSPAWWDYLWLSEGFATYFEHYTTEEVSSDWRMMDLFLPDTVYTAMEFDSQTYTNPMTSSVNSPNEIDSNFNRIAYQKSGSVIRMVEHIMGKENFHQGLKNYLKSIPKGVAVPEDLFKGLQEAIKDSNILPSGVTMSDIFGGWSTTPGFPIVTAKRSVGDRSITLRQERFFEDKSISHDGERWWIPITWATSHEYDFENTTLQELFRPETTEHVVEMNLRENAWYILNKQATGYFRIMYDEHNWKLLADFLKSENFTDIHLLNRVQLIDDSLEFARTLRMSYNVTFDLLFYLREETDFVPWLTVYPHILYLNIFMAAAENHASYREYIRQLTKKAYDTVGFEADKDDKPDVRMNREILLHMACTAGIRSSRDDSTELLEKWLANNTIEFDPDLKDLIYCCGMRDAPPELWESFWAKFESSSSATERSIILRNLACTENSTIIDSYLTKAINPDSNLTQSQRSTIIESTITSGYRGVDRAVNLITKNFTEIKRVTPSNTVRIINTIRGRIVKFNDAEEFEKFVNTYENFSNSERTAAENALEVIRENREWLEDVLYDVDPWLEDNIFASSAIPITVTSVLIVVSIVLPYV